MKTEITIIAFFIATALACIVAGCSETVDERNERLRQEALREPARPDPAHSGNTSGPGNF